MGQEVQDAEESLRRASIALRSAELAQELVDSALFEATRNVQRCLADRKQAEIVMLDAILRESLKPILSDE